MRKVDIIQGSSAWLEMRQDKIGASDAAIILGLSSYKSAYDLYLEKTGKKAPEATNANQRAGNEREGPMRTYYNQQTESNMQPAVLLHPEQDWLMASLDGLSEDGKSLLEIKLMGFERFEQVKERIIGPDHMLQMQIQLACAPEAEYVDYLCCTYKGEIAPVIRVRRQDISAKVDKLYQFWLCVKENRSPEILTTDCALIEDNQEFKSAAKAWKIAHRTLKEAEILEKQARDTLTKFASGGSVMGFGVKIDRLFREGSVDYKNIPELDGVDLQKYRKSPTTYYRLSEEKK